MADPYYSNFISFDGDAYTHDTITTSEGTFVSQRVNGDLVDAAYYPPEERARPPAGLVWADEAGLPGCDVYWGSHGCHLPRDHAGDHQCDCCDCPDHAANRGIRRDDDGSEWTCVATAPFYGPDTYFYGDDAK